MSEPGAHDLAPLMAPRRIAVIGASQRMSRATRVVANLKRFGYGGRIFPINPRYDTVLDLPCYPDLASTPEPADSVVVGIPAEQVPGVLTAAVDSGVRAAVVLSSGFAEAGPAGQQRQAALEHLAVERGLLICGPNCYGVFNIRLGAATFSADIAEPRPGGVAVVSQSGGFSHAIAEHLMRQRAAGLSYIVSCGNQAGLGVEDYVDFLVEDDDTAVIGVFVEGFKRPERLREVAARARARRKPVVVLKVGRSENARQAMLAHTGSLAGAPEIVEAVLKQSGLVQVTSLNEMIDTLALMAAAGRYARKSWRLAVLSGLGGECGNLSDIADRVGVELPPLAASTVDTVRSFMPDFANPRNPLDGTGAMYENPALFPRLIDTLLHDETVDVVAFNTRVNVPAPGGWAPARDYARTLCEAVRRGTDRLVLCFNSFPAGDLDQEVVRPLAAAGIPFLEGSETTLLALRHLRAYRASLDRPVAPLPAAPAVALPVGIRGVLPDAEAMRLLREGGIRLAETHAAKDAEQAVRAAEAVGYPVALKVDSPDIAHKTDVGGVRLGCADGAAVREGVSALLDEVRRRAPAARLDGVLVQRMVTGGTEMLVGVKRDPQWGPAIVCGFGGIFVELLRDAAVRVPPLDRAEALAMLAELRGAALLRGARGRPPADVDALADTLVRVARLAESHGASLRALDLNPLVVLAEGHGAVAVDWLVELD
ncbi:MAG TPA: acetate--CoA ligase family protein [Methylomirabilota bacterium]|nr:acetate--CoA ligase family protein [Methylomirabilota bacterium]